MYNPTFSQVEIWFRFVFVVLTFMVTVRTLIFFFFLFDYNVLEDKKMTIYLFL